MADDKPTEPQKPTEEPTPQLSAEYKRERAEKWLKEKQARMARLRAREAKNEARALAEDRRKRDASPQIFGHRDHNRQLSERPLNPAKLTRISDFATIVQKFYAVADKAITELHNSPEFGPKEVGALAQLARTLPLLQQAEEGRRARVGEQDLKQLSTEQLYGLVDKFSRRLDVAKRKETIAARKEAREATAADPLDEEEDDDA